MRLLLPLLLATLATLAPVLCQEEFDVERVGQAGWSLALEDRAVSGSSSPLRDALTSTLAKKTPTYKSTRSRKTLAALQAALDSISEPPNEVETSRRGGSDLSGVLERLDEFLGRRERQMEPPGTDPPPTSTTTTTTTEKPTTTSEKPTTTAKPKTTTMGYSVNHHNHYHTHSTHHSHSSPHYSSHHSPHYSSFSSDYSHSSPHYLSSSSSDYSHYSPHYLSSDDSHSSTYYSS